MNTLFVYCSSDDILNSLCKESVRKKTDTVSMELSGDIDKTGLFRYFGANRRVYCASERVDMSEYDKIILACDEYMGEIPSALCAFITGNDFRYKQIDCIVFGDGRGCRRAIDSVRIKVSLSGGTVSNAIGVSAKELKRESEDILFSVRHRMAV